jgi:hypothetical protein
MILVRSMLAGLALALSTATLAQTPAPAAASASVPPPTCKKPGEHPGRLALDGARRAWVKDANGYLECLKKYATEQQAIGKPLIDQARPHIEAANAAIEEHNKAAAQFKAEQDKND